MCRLQVIKSSNVIHFKIVLVGCAFFFLFFFSFFFFFLPFSSLFLDIEVMEGLSWIELQIYVLTLFDNC